MSNYVIADRDQNSVLFEDPNNTASTLRHKRNLGRKVVDEARLHNIRSEYIIQREHTPSGITDLNIREPLSVRVIITGSDGNQAELDKMVDTLFKVVSDSKAVRAAGRLLPSDSVLTINPTV